MIIIGDIGNSESKICFLSSKKKIIKKITFNTKNINISNLNKHFKKSNISKMNIHKCLFCSVVPSKFNLIQKFFYKNFNLKCYELKTLPIKSIMKINVNNKQIGSDRLANALGVINHKDNFIILDFGTATTFDVLIKNVYHGGIISPGIKLSLNTLIDNATLIPKINLKKVNKVIGSNTISAVRSGFFWGYKGLIDKIITLIKKETGKSFKLIITGGFSDLFKNSSISGAKIDKDITMKGLIKACDLLS